MFIDFILFTQTSQWSYQANMPMQCWWEHIVQANPPHIYVVCSYVLNGGSKIGLIIVICKSFGKHRTRKEIFEPSSTETG